MLGHRLLGDAHTNPAMLRQPRGCSAALSVWADGEKEAQARGVPPHHPAVVPCMQRAQLALPQHLYHSLAQPQLHTGCERGQHVLPGCALQQFLHSPPSHGDQIHFAGEQGSPQARQTLGDMRPPCSRTTPTALPRSLRKGAARAPKLQPLSLGFLLGGNSPKGAWCCRG